MASLHPSPLAMLPVSMQHNVNLLYIVQFIQASSKDALIQHPKISVITRCRGATTPKVPVLPVRICLELRTSNKPGCFAAGIGCFNANTCHHEVLLYFITTLHAHTLVGPTAD